MHCMPVTLLPVIKKYGDEELNTEMKAFVSEPDVPARSQRELRVGLRVANSV